MDNRSLISKVEKRTQSDVKTAGAMADALTRIIADSNAALDNVAIPGFGTFIALKNDEHIETDPKNGQRTLMPPSVTVTFRSAVKLRKAATSR